MEQLQCSYKVIEMTLLCWKRQSSFHCMGSATLHASFKWCWHVCCNFWKKSNLTLKWAHLQMVYRWATCRFTNLINLGAKHLNHFLIQSTLRYPEPFYQETALSGQDFQERTCIYHSPGRRFIHELFQLGTFRYLEIRYLEDIFKVPKVPDKWGLTVYEFCSSHELW